MKSSQDKKATISEKQHYTQPAIEVYEVEMEGAVLAASSMDRDYQDWSKANSTPLDGASNFGIDA